MHKMTKAHPMMMTKDGHDESDFSLKMKLFMIGGAKHHM